MSPNTEEVQRDTSLEKKDKQVFSDREEYNQQIEGTPLFLRKKSVEEEGWSITFGNRIIYNGESGHECRDWVEKNPLTITVILIDIMIEEAKKSQIRNRKE